MSVFSVVAVAAPSVGTIGDVAPELAYMSIVAAFIGVLCWNIGNKILTPLNGVLFMDVVPITAFTVSAATGTAPVAMQLVGAALTVDRPDPQKPLPASHDGPFAGVAAASQRGTGAPGGRGSHQRR